MDASRTHQMNDLLLVHLGEATCDAGSNLAALADHKGTIGAPTSVIAQKSLLFRKLT